MMLYKIQKQHFRGEGLAVPMDGSSNRTVHIANALSGETVEAEEPDWTREDLMRERRHFALFNQAAEPSEDRCTPHCPHWRTCAACQFQCLKEEAQNALKRSNWSRLIYRLLRTNDLELPIDFMPAIRRTGYRCRAEGTWQDGIIGLMPRRDYIAVTGDCRLIPLRECRAQSSELNAYIAQVETLCAFANLPSGTRVDLEANNLDLAANVPERVRISGLEVSCGKSASHSTMNKPSSNRRLTVYAAPNMQEEVLKSAKILADNLPGSVIFQVLPPRGSHVWPSPKPLTETAFYVYDMDIFGHALYALKGAWTPVNPINAHLLRDTLASLLKSCDGESVLEIGCGCGTHASLFSGRKYTGIDASWPAVQSAQVNAEISRQCNAAFYTDTADHYLVKRYFEGRRAEIILMHSNRLPYSPQAAEYCMKFGARDILIAAPTAYALSQECRHFTELGYKICRCILCDTMPETYHMMGTAHLQRI